MGCENHCSSFAVIVFTLNQRVPAGTDSFHRRSRLRQFRDCLAQTVRTQTVLIGVGNQGNMRQRLAPASLFASRWPTRKIHTTTRAVLLFGLPPAGVGRGWADGVHCYLSGSKDSRVELCPTCFSLSSGLARLNVLRYGQYHHLTVPDLHDKLKLVGHGYVLRRIE